MKGIVFTEFLEMVEKQFGLEVADTIIRDANLEHEGAYTSVGTYQFSELVKLVVSLSKLTKVEISELLRVFGNHFFMMLYRKFPKFMDQHKSSLDFMETIDKHIHVEVRKLYPEAELPKFDYDRVSANEMKLTYSSPRALSDFACGLIYSCAEHYHESVELRTTDLSGGKGTKVEILIKKQE